jgi:hypothetical protein
MLAISLTDHLFFERKAERQRLFSLAGFRDLDTQPTRLGAVQDDLCPLREGPFSRLAVARVGDQSGLIENNPMCVGRFWPSFAE